MLVWSDVLAMLDRCDRAAMATIAAVRGSSPREAGARMVVGPDGTFTGTIGGGALEWQALARARAMLDAEDAGGAQVRSFALGPELGQCCGGHVDIVFETFGAAARPAVAELAARESGGRFATRGRIGDGGVMRTVLDDVPRDGDGTSFEGGVLTETFGDARRRLYLFGAGHVGRALVLAMAPLPFSVVWIDGRADAFPSHVPRNVTPRPLADPAAAVADAGEGSFALVMTHSHQLDLAAVEALLGDARFAFVGLIGSRTKRSRFEKRLAEAGVAADRIAAMVCPIGQPGIRSKAPAVIAAATAADLLERDEALRREGADSAAAQYRRSEAVPVRPAGAGRR